MASLFKTRRTLLHLLMEARVERDECREEYLRIKERMEKITAKNCNNCGAGECRYAPKYGKLSRFNCPFWEAKGE